MSLAVSRRPQFVLIVCTLASCWLAMQIVHELGHVLGAWWTGGVVAKVILRPWTFSRTELASNPDPALVAWAGPVVGALAPLVLWLAAKIGHCPGAYLLRFFAGYCLIANGAYLGGGALDRAGDAGDLQRHGMPAWPLLLFAVLTVPIGLWLWHGQGRHFGFAGAGGRVSRRAVWAVAAVLLLLIGVECLFAFE
jgi:hypothetical protein